MTDPYNHAIAYSDDGMREKVIQKGGPLSQPKGGGPYAVNVLESYAYGTGILEAPVLKDIIAPDGTRFGTVEYDSSGRKIGLIDHDGNRILFGDLSAAAQAGDAPEHHDTVTDRRGNPTSDSDDSDGNVTSVTDAEGNSVSYAYTEQGKKVSETDQRKSD